MSLFFEDRYGHSDPLLKTRMAANFASHPTFLNRVPKVRDVCFYLTLVIIRKPGLRNFASSNIIFYKIRSYNGVMDEWYSTTTPMKFPILTKSSNQDTNNILQVHQQITHSRKCRSKEIPTSGSTT